MKDDTISRAAALDFIDSMNWCDEISDEAFKKITIHLENLPSAQPERKPGKWIYGEDEHGVDGYHCDECGFFVPWDYVHKFINYIEDYNFCPNCGADMRGDGNDFDTD